MVTKPDAISDAARRVRRATEHLGIQEGVREKVIADATAQVAACEAALRKACDAFPNPGELAPPNSEGAAK